MDKRVRVLDLLAVALGSALTRLLLTFGNTGLHSFDAGNLLLGAMRYDLSADQPHLPGYPLFTWLVSVLPWDALHNAHILIVTASALAAACTYGALTSLFDRRTALSATVLLMVVPYVWYYTSVVETYVFDLLFASAIVWAATHPRTVFTLPSLLALAGGFRPTTMVFLAPLTALLLWRQRERLQGFRVIESLLLGVLTMAAWLVPMMQASGGPAEYLSLYSTNSPLPERSFVQNMEGLVLHLPYFLTPIVLVRLLGKRSTTHATPFDAILFIAWLIPAATALVFLHYAKGYLLLIAVPIMILVVQPWKRNYAWTAWGAGVAAAVAIFWLLPAHPADPRTVMRQDQRSMSTWQTSVDRFFSVYSLTSSAYHLHEQLIALERSVAADGQRLAPTNVMVDPTCVVRPRVLQILAPQQRYASLRTDTTNAAWIYAGADRVLSRPATSVFSESALITQERFARETLGTSVRIVAQRGPWVGCAILQPERVQRIYDSLFVRVR